MRKDRALRIGFIGTGNMGGAIIRGYAASQCSVDNQLLICNRTEERSRCVYQDIAKAGHAVEICACPEELADKADIIIIGVKPAVVPEILRRIAPAIVRSLQDLETADPGHAKPPKKLIISMAAGVSIAKMAAALRAGGDNAAEDSTKSLNFPHKIMRIMPNTPAKVGQAMTSISRSSNVSDEELACAVEIFNAIGRCEEVPEEMIDCVIGVSGSSPAYTYMYIQALAQAARENGMEKAKARAFAAQAVLGAAKMVLESEESLDQLRINVCSPGGTTIEAVNRLFENGFMENVREGFQAAVDRSVEMTAEDNTEEKQGADR